MAKLRSNCPTCGKEAKSKAFFTLDGVEYVTLQCGHMLISEREKGADYSDFESEDGRKLYPFQVSGCEFAEQSGFNCLIADEMGLGKGGIRSGKILTPNGWSTYGEINLGDRIIGSNGLENQVIGIFMRGVLQTYKVEFSDGSSTIVDGDHLWEVNTALRKWRGNKPLVKKTSQLINDLHTTSKNSTGKKNFKWYIPIMESANLDFQETPLDPYALGLLLGDGGFTHPSTITFSTKDNELSFALGKLIPDELAFNKPNYNIRGGITRRILQELNLLGLYSHEKFIPSCYKFNTIENRLEILRGLMDTDGSIYGKNTIEYVTTSEKLKEDVKFLVQSLGGVAYESTKIPKYIYKGEKKDGKLAYRLIINIPVNPFSLPRKANLYKYNEKYGPTRAIVSITPHSVEDVICISTSAKDQLYITDDFIVTHNTVQALALIKKHSELLPVLILTKTALKYQWFAEVVRWTGLVPQIIEGSDSPLPFIKVFICSIDLLKNRDDLDTWKFKTLIIDECQSIKNISSKRTHNVRKLAKQVWTVEREEVNDIGRIKTIAEDLMKYHGVFGRFSLHFANIGSTRLGICECNAKKTNEGIITGKITISDRHAREDSESEVIETILHEIAHAITPGAGHSKIWKDTNLAIFGNGETVAQCEGTSEIVNVQEKVKVIALSGTPIKNRANEYFPILNLIRPEIFYSEPAFMRDWVGSYWDGRKSKTGRLLNPREFAERTKDFIIRRERKEVLPDLPPINRTFSYSELSKEAEKHYKLIVKQFTEFVEEKGGQVGGKNTGETLAYLTRMRHCTGLAKIESTIEFVSEFLFDTDRKLTIFVHHKDVGEKIKAGLEKACRENDLSDPLVLNSSLNSEERDKVVREFKENPLKRILIASTLASGEGLNLQFCSDCIMVERQWNPANEEQAEGRFSRIGSTAEKINATYMTAIGTIDEFFMKLVEAKRKLVNEAMTGKKVNWDESEVLTELSDMIIKHGRKAWGF